MRNSSCNIYQYYLNQGMFFRDMNKMLPTYFLGKMFKKWWFTPNELHQING